MASEIFGTAALFWVLIPVGLLGGGLLLKLLKDLSLIHISEPTRPY